MSGICDHAVGEGCVDYWEKIISVSNGGDGVAEHTFYPFQFCPHCGKDVSEEAQLVEDKIAKHWDEFWKWYATQHGEAEMKRARRIW
jgi:hypothetical protein